MERIPFRVDRDEISNRDWLIHLDDKVESIMVLLNQAEQRPLTEDSSAVARCARAARRSSARPCTTTATRCRPSADYRELREAEGKAEDLVRRRAGRMRRFELSDSERAVLAAWRTDLDPPGAPGAVEDPTSAQLEPDLRRFEEQGDPPL